ncbi:hypothetical protein BDV23DRAFT_171527 [Aspergillus alliaceus]|uniref:Uncharacterized protein n=1 Tax=Petromyces alliaceus TaxID=209559 RepID=A0A5N7CBM8_PETAA|nr:hypothetical protein BDV23DRAFT_171527 [Aspergillus alliaceus]
MLFEPSLDALLRVSPTIDLARYFCELPPPASQPILDASYPFFLLIADITRLARSTRPLNDIEVQAFNHLLADLLHYEKGLSDSSPGIGWYLLTMRIFLLKVHPTVTSVGATQQINHLSANGFTVLNSLKVDEYLLGFTLWPVAVLRSIAVTVSEKCIVERKISLLARRQRGLTMRLRDRFRAIWATPQVDKSTILVQRLHMLVKII